MLLFKCHSDHLFFSTRQYFFFRSSPMRPESLLLSWKINSVFMENKLCLNNKPPEDDERKRKKEKIKKKKTYGSYIIYILETVQVVQKIEKLLDSHVTCPPLLCYHHLRSFSVSMHPPWTPTLSRKHGFVLLLIMDMNRVKMFVLIFFRILLNKLFDSLST